MPKTVSPIPQDAVLQILLIGHGEENFFVIRDLLSRGNSATRAELEHATSYEEALLRIGETEYDLILFEYEAQDGIVLQLLPELRRLNTTVPVIFLAEYADEGTLAEIIAAGACDFVKKSELCEEYLGRSIRYAVNLHRKHQKRQQAEEMLRKLFQAVEQSADLVMITDQAGLIEYVNPAFETLTGYASEEVVGNTVALLKSAEQAPGIYGELWATVLSGKVFRGTLALTAKRMATSSIWRRRSLPLAIRKVTSPTLSATIVTSLSGASWRLSFGRLKRWMPSDSWRVASRMISITS
ncbi:MAG: hypothetical protein DMG73_05930 [Acidobacteria bacterium]|nr:MAG: hypothetical protein DMG73_05930 [Acidobacteriota bacterium]